MATSNFSRLLIGTTVGWIAVAPAEAGDLPVKAKAIDYVRACSLRLDLRIMARTLRVVVRGEGV